MKYDVNKFISTSVEWLGCNESDGTHKNIIDVYNSYIPHPRGYKVSYNDAWCATFVSAVAIKLGYTDIIPIECSCYYMIENAKKMGIWVENDSYKPIIGDIIMYDWDDSGKGDNNGIPDHVGIVTKINGSTFKVIEGNNNHSVSYRTMNVNDKYIRGYIHPRFTEEFIPKTNKTLKEIALCAVDVCIGVYGDGETRETKLKNEGFDPEKIQEVVNALM